VSAPTVIPVPIRPALLAWLRSVPLERAARARSEAARLRLVAALENDEGSRAAIPPPRRGLLLDRRHRVEVVGARLE